MGVEEFGRFAQAPREMKLEASTAGFSTSPISGKEYPLLQILINRELLEEHSKSMLSLLILSTREQVERFPSNRAAEHQGMFR